MVIWSAVDETAKVLTTDFVATSQTTAWHPVYGGSELVLLLTGSGTDPTSFDAVVEISYDGGTTGFLAPAVATIVSGVVDFDPAILRFPGVALGTGVTHERWASPPVAIPPGCHVRVLVRRVGGDATSAAVVRAVISEV